MKVEMNESHVAKRLQELRGWADYIVESLTRDQRYESGKMELLERLLDERELRDLRDLAASLADRLNRIRVRPETLQSAAR
jgi:hypothetical protein